MNFVGCLVLIECRIDIYRVILVMLCMMCGRRCLCSSYVYVGQ